MLRRWAVVAVVAIVTLLTVIMDCADEMPELHHVADTIAVAVIVPAWVLELSGACRSEYGWRLPWREELALAAAAII